MPKYLRRSLPGLLVGVVTLALAAPAMAVQGSYTFTTQHGVTFPLFSGATHDIVPASGQTDDVLFRLGTSSSFTGAFHMPFAVAVYGTSYTTMTVDSNGNIQFGVCCSGGTSVYNNAALPTANFAKPMLAVFWDDLYFVPSDTSHFFQEGIYTKTSGTKPHRTFVISWQGHAFNNEAYLVLAQAVFKEGSPTLRFRYGSADNQSTFPPSETIGTQGSGGTGAPFTQVAFDPPPPGVVTSGTQFTFTHH